MSRNCIILVFVCLFLLQLHFHAQGSDTLFDYIPREVVPVEFGGKGTSIFDIKGKYDGREDIYIQYMGDESKIYTWIQR